MFIMNEIVINRALSKGTYLCADKNVNAFPISFNTMVKAFLKSSF
jgi:hypothetical protein